MALDITLPEISENVDEAEIIHFLVKKGDQVDKDQAIVELESEKAAFEVPSPEAGTISELVASEGDTVKVGDVLARLDAGGKAEPEKEEPEEKAKEDEEEKEAEKVEEKEDEAAEEEEKAEKIKEKQASEKKKEAEKAAAEKEEEKAEKEKAKKAEEKKEPEAKKEPSREVKEPTGAAQVPAAPSVRRLAREIGVDITRVQGSGPGGRISMDDVKVHAKQQIQEKPAAPRLELPDFERWGPVHRESMTRVRQITADSTGQAWSAVPHVTQFETADITGVEAFRQRHAKQADKAGGKLTVTAILLKLCAVALQRFPRFNASLDMENKEIIYKNYVHIGVAVDTERGLLVPVIRDVDQKGVIELSAELVDIADKTRNKKIKPDQLEGGNFSISNLGSIGGAHFTPIIYHPQVAILGVGRGRPEPRLIDGEWQERMMLPLALSYDHRIIDGADGARFMTWLKQALEDPMTILMQGGSL
ncbi:hypothetical protein GF406_09025 [candidate division KSB1 bacterium]|nr:hypothetical protein [candidate division KSB1 bacterium]